MLQRAGALSGPRDFQTCLQSGDNYGPIAKKFFYTLLFICAYSGVARAELTVYGSQIGEYMTKVGPTLDQSSGLMFEITAAAFKKAGIAAKMAPEVPWARAQQEASDGAGGVLVILARTPAREPNWKWVSVIYNDKVFGYTMKDRPSFSSYDEIKSKKPSVGVKLGSASESILKDSGVDLQTTADIDKSFMKLLLGRIDVVILQGMEVYPALQGILKGADANQYRSKMGDLKRTALVELPLWVATSKKTSEADEHKMREALESFKKTPEYQAIVQKYESRLDKAGLQ